MTDNFVSNEVIVARLSVVNVWRFLVNVTEWPNYYSNATDIYFYDDKGPELVEGMRFRFATFGFPIEAEVTECVSPVTGQVARLAWHGWAEGDAKTRLDVHHAWLLEDLPKNRVRILTQESQIGEPAKELAITRPNPMINGHQDWLDGLVAVACKVRI